MTISALILSAALAATWDGEKPVSIENDGDNKRVLCGFRMPPGQFLSPAVSGSRVRFWQIHSVPRLILEYGSLRCPGQAEIPSLP